MPKLQQITVNVRLAPDDLNEIDTLAKHDDRSRSYIIRKLIRSALDAIRSNASPPHEEDAE